LSPGGTAKDNRGKTAEKSANFDLIVSLTALDFDSTALNFDSHKFFFLFLCGCLLVFFFLSLECCLNAPGARLYGVVVNINSCFFFFFEDFDFFFNFAVVSLLSRLHLASITTPSPLSPAAAYFSVFLSTPHPPQKKIYSKGGPLDFFSWIPQKIIPKKKKIPRGDPWIFFFLEFFFVDYSALSTQRTTGAGAPRPRCTCATG
jgi:hypothetical protein